MKMLLLVDGKLSPDDLTQNAIANVDKSGLVSTLDELFNNFLQSGFLLLNASLCLGPLSVNKESRYWLPFISSIFQQTTLLNPSIQLILLGNIAKKISPALPKPVPKIITAEHPYNLSFITNPVVQKLFKSFKLLEKCANISVHKNKNAL